MQVVEYDVTGELQSGACMCTVRPAVSQRVESQELHVRHTCRRNYRALVETTVALADKVGCSEIVGFVVEDLKDESEPYR